MKQKIFSLFLVLSIFGMSLTRVHAQEPANSDKFLVAKELVGSNLPAFLCTAAGAGGVIFFSSSKVRSRVGVGLSALTAIGCASLPFFSIAPLVSLRADLHETYGAVGEDIYWELLGNTLSLQEIAQQYLSEDLQNEFIRTYSPE